ncbi:MAG: 30S ribosomal protein S14 [Alphaproteobacteria bacterium]|jgi:small subunit ribosomal protein S14|nr:30S ribosomal protein S14 [Alphaproteobacteria bacterium]
MAKKSSVQKNLNRAKLVARYADKRARLKAIANDKELPIEERFQAGLKLSEMPRNGAKIRLRNRCEVSGRPRGYYRKFKMSRIALRELGSAGQVPGLVKSSW